MKILLVTPYYPYPAHKTGGIHTIHMIIKNMLQNKIDIFYYGENRDISNEIKFSHNINQVYYEDLRQGGTIQRLTSILKRKTYTSYLYKITSSVLNTVLNNAKYDAVIYDQFSSMQLVKVDANLNILFMHDSLPLLFSRKKNLTGFVGKIYYSLQTRFAVKEEKEKYRDFNKVVFVSSKDADEEGRLHPDYIGKFEVCNLGIEMDVVAKSPMVKLKDNSLIFTGVMDYEPNEDAMIYFVNSIYQKIKALRPQVHLYIVGKNPTKKLLDLVSEEEGITVTGRVDNIFSYIKSAGIYISPLRMGSGKKNKIIEAMACSIPIIASNVSMDGFDDLQKNNVIKCAEQDYEWVEQIVELLDNPKECERIKISMSGLINEEYDWKNIAKQLVTKLS